MTATACTDATATAAAPMVRTICCTGAGYVGGPTMAVIADRSAGTARRAFQSLWRRQLEGVIRLMDFDHTCPINIGNPGKLTIR